MQVEVIDRTGEISVYEDITELQFQNNPFHLIAPDYMLEITKSDDSIYEVTNAVDGYGNNCKDLFRDASVTVYN